VRHRRSQRLAIVTLSLIVPVYLNEPGIADLVAAVRRLNELVNGRLEAVFVVDGSPDRSFELLQAALETLPFPAQLLAHSRNFGSFPAIRTGLHAARGEYFAVMAADLQEPLELIVAFFASLTADECDVVVGVRNSRQDPPLSRLGSTIFWSVYRRFVVKDIPIGGVDVFGCNRTFRQQLLQLEESRSSLIALIFWLGFRRTLVPYERRSRKDGKSAWTLRKKIDYMTDSVFAFTDYPIRIVIRTGLVGSAVSGILAGVVVIARLLDRIPVPGYAATMIAVLFLGTLNLLGLGVVGAYAWRAYENSKARPLAVVAVRRENQRSL
jgi:glycosyltransferase involved in cell wall biosynthesis